MMIRIMMMMMIIIIVMVVMTVVPVNPLHGVDLNARPALWRFL